MKHLFTPFLLVLLFSFCYQQTVAQSLFKDLIPGAHPASGTPDHFLKVNGKMFFVASVITGGLSNHQLWVSDGTVANTVKIKDSLTITNIFGPVELRADVNGILYFTVIDDPGCTVCAPELWKSDGTEAGTVMVTTLDYTSFAGGGTGTAPTNFTAVGDKIFFQFGQTNGTELWVSDGTAAGTVEVVDLATGVSFGIPNAGAASEPMIGYKGKVYFHGGTTLGNGELFSSDGTAAGTVLVSEINSGTMSGSEPSGWYIFNDELYFLANDGEDGIWKTDGVSAPTKLFSPSGFTQPTVFKGELYFGSSNYSLWKTNGTTAGTVMIKDLVGNPRGANNDFIFTHYPKILSVAPWYENVLWKSDGTTAGTEMTSYDIGMTSSRNVIGNNMYITRTDSGSTTTVGVWVTDGTSAGTSKVLDGFGTGNVFIYNNMVFFSNYETATGYELWTINPGVSGVEKLELNQSVSIYPNPSSGTFAIDIPNYSEMFNVEIYSISGEKISEQRTGKLVDLTNAPKGIYFAKIYAGEQLYNAKIIVE